MTAPDPDPRFLDLFLSPRRVAIIGLSRAAVGAPISILTTLKDFGYQGRITVINPNIVPTEEYEAYASLNEVPEAPGAPKPIDLAVISVPREGVLNVLKDCARNGIRAAIVITQGFADADESGKKLQAEMLAFARDNGIRILGPNTIGVANAFSGFTSSFIEAHNDTFPVGLVSQSGLFMMGHNIVNNEPGGFCMAADLGNAADIGLDEVLAYYEGIDGVRVIQCHLEGIERGAAFVETAARVSHIKPIVLLKAGRTEAGQVAVASHSGAVAGETEVYRAAFRKSGIVTADNAEQLRILSKAFVTYAPPKGRRVAIMSFSGGGAILAIDAIEAAGLTLATLSETTKADLRDLFPSWIAVDNPLDVWIPIARDLHTAFPKILEATLRDEGVDAVICIYCSYTLPKYDAYDSSIHIRDLADRYPDKPVLCWSYGMDIAGFTRQVERDGTAMVFPSLDDAAGALAKLAAYGEYRAHGVVPAPPAETSPGALAANRILSRAADAGTDFLFAEGLEILQAYGLNVAAWSMAGSERELVENAESLTYPLCLKAVSQDLVHKSDTGGIILSIGDREELLKAYRELHAAVRERAPEAQVSAVLVQEMAPKGKELMIGAKRDPSFGPCLIVGAGGIYTEILDDHAFRLAPVTEAEARGMIAELAFSKILAGARGEPACHLPSIVEVLLKVSQLICAHPQIREIDLNPLIANERGAVIVDSRIIL
jgi:acetyltransferase